MLYSSPQFCEIGPVITSIFQLRNLRYRALRNLHPGDTAGKWQSWVMNVASQTSRAHILILLNHLPCVMYSLITDVK